MGLNSIIGGWSINLNTIFAGDGNKLPMTASFVLSAG